MNEWLTEIQTMFNDMKDSPTFWVVGGIAVLLALAALRPRGRR